MGTGRGKVPYVKGRAKLSVLYLIPITLPPSKVSLTAYGQLALFSPRSSLVRRQGLHTVPLGCPTRLLFDTC